MMVTAPSRCSAFMSACRVPSCGKSEDSPEVEAVIHISLLLPTRFRSADPCDTSAAAFPGPWWTNARSGQLGCPRPHAEDGDAGGHLPPGRRRMALPPAE